MHASNRMSETVPTDSACAILPKPQKIGTQCVHVAIDCKAVPFLFPNQRMTWVRGRGLELFLFPPFSPVPRGHASHTSRLLCTRVIRWLGEKKGTALQSNVATTSCGYNSPVSLNGSLVTHNGNLIH